MQYFTIICLSTDNGQPFKDIYDICSRISNMIFYGLQINTDETDISAVVTIEPHIPTDMELVKIVIQVTPINTDENVTVGNVVVKLCYNPPGRNLKFHQMFHIKKFLNTVVANYPSCLHEVYI